MKAYTSIGIRILFAVGFAIIFIGIAYAAYYDPSFSLKTKFLIIGNLIIFYIAFVALSVNRFEGIINRHSHRKKALALYKQGNLDEALHFFLKYIESWGFHVFNKYYTDTLAALIKLQRVMEQVSQIINEKGQKFDIVDDMIDTINSLVLIYNDKKNFSSLDGSLQSYTKQRVDKLKKKLEELHPNLRKALNMQNFEPEN